MRIFAERGTTQINLSELAQVAGVARGTVYNNLKAPEGLFEEVAANLVTEMHRRASASFAGIDDPAVRLAVGIRLFIRRAHEEPHWGRFIVRFAYSNMTMQGIWAGPPAMDLQEGLRTGRYSFDPGKFVSVLAAVAGSCLSAIFLVLEGHKTWREAGSDTAEFALRGLGLPAEEAAAIANVALPPLAR
ncbi:TetR/AcrR family transcriptional regulator [Rhizobium rhizogenes]|uniref:TetR/AcrR family transcriptional regulator n=1 Tax=Rhizobium rhizogenes TaxID=359 RepID=UPI001AEED2D5|nr:TetR family transcriptional regulator [Rhizobium rhizogenes]